MEPPESNSGTPGAAAAAASAPDAVTASLLEKHAAGVKLSSSEYGKLGSFARWLKKPFGKDNPAAGPAQPGSAPGNPARVAALAQNQTAGDGLAPVEVDDGLCQRTTAAILNRADAFAVGYIERAAKSAAAGLDSLAQDKIIDRFRTAAALPVADKKLLVEISPDVFRELGWDPRKFAVWTACGVLGLHGVNIWQAVNELKAMRREIVDVKAKVEPQPEPVPIKPGTVPKPEETTKPGLDKNQKLVELPKQ